MCYAVLALHRGKVIDAWAFDCSDEADKFFAARCESMSHRGRTDSKFYGDQLIETRYLNMAARAAIEDANFIASHPRLVSDTFRV